MTAADPYEAALAALRTERGRIDAAIATLERMRGMPAAPEKMLALPAPAAPTPVAPPPKARPDGASLNFRPSTKVPSQTDHAEARAEYERGDRVVDIAARHRVSSPTVYNWIERGRWQRAAGAAPAHAATAPAAPVAAPSADRDPAAGAIIPAETSAKNTLEKAGFAVQRIGAGRWQVNDKPLTREEFIHLGLSVRMNGAAA